jgi:dynein heavy chain 1, cytosolic
MIRHLVTEMYGGKIDDEADHKLLANLVGKFLTPDAYEAGHRLVDDRETATSLVVPDGTSLGEYMEWIQNLPEREPPTFLGLPANAEKLLLVALGASMISNVGKVADLLDEGEQIMAEA